MINGQCVLPFARIRRDAAIRPPICGSISCECTNFFHRVCVCLLAETSIAWSGSCVDDVVCRYWSYCEQFQFNRFFVCRRRRRHRHPRMQPYVQMWWCNASYATTVVAGATTSRNQHQRTSSKSSPTNVTCSINTNIRACLRVWQSVHRDDAMCFGVAVVVMVVCLRFPL